MLNEYQYAGGLTEDKNEIYVLCMEEDSLGMKQRLGLAVALLHDPEFLILDEPTNGLDPQGIIDLREHLQYLAKTFNKTILISSHLLSEVEMIVKSNYEEAAARVGSVVENPSFYEHLTGYQNLKYLGGFHSHVSKERIEEIVQLVDLTGSIHKPVKT
ncbi:ATP-binding cassette domain-containing protein [Bacillus licheniformis]|nr:ATP-binding cassette domain-containing protein [Bacillus licheniformis]